MVKVDPKTPSQQIQHPTSTQQESSQGKQITSSGRRIPTAAKVAFAIFVPIVGWGYGIFKIVQFCKGRTAKKQEAAIKVQQYQPDVQSFNLGCHLENQANKIHESINQYSFVEVLHSQRDVVKVQFKLGDQLSGKKYDTLQLSGGVEGTIKLDPPQTIAQLSNPKNLTPCKVILDAAGKIEKGGTITVNLRS